MPSISVDNGNSIKACKYCNHTIRKGETYSEGVIHWDDIMCGFCIHQFSIKLSNLELEISNLPK